MLNDNWAQLNKSTEKLLGPKNRRSFLHHAVRPDGARGSVPYPNSHHPRQNHQTAVVRLRRATCNVISKELDTVVTVSQADLGEAHGNFLDPNCTDLACRRKALDDSSLVLELSASNGKDLKEIQRDQDLQTQTLQDVAKACGKSTLCRAPVVTIYGWT
ncbi:uncharacterized protein ACBT44_010885 isoform 2-T2 [Syngnathus typhle]